MSDEIILYHIRSCCCFDDDPGNWDLGVVVGMDYRAGMGNTGWSYCSRHLGEIQNTIDQKSGNGYFLPSRSMGIYGNSGGKNRGKKYVKLKGGEVATPKNEANANDFMAWYSRAVDELRKSLYEDCRDDDLMTETALHIYDCIALKGLNVDNYRGYYLRAYHTARMAQRKKNARMGRRMVSLDESRPGTNKRETAGEGTNVDSDRKDWEVEREKLETEIREYVQTKYDDTAVSLFEIYTALYPNISYKRLAVLLGWPIHRIWPVIGAIRKDVAERFGEEYGRVRMNCE